MMNTAESSPDQWDACPPGEFQRLVTERKAGRRKAAAMKGISAAVVVIIAVAGGGLVANQFLRTREFHYGNIACRDVRPLLADYSAGRLDAALAEQVREHLAECPLCGPLYRRMQANMDRSRQPLATPRVSVIPVAARTAFAGGMAGFDGHGAAHGRIRL